MKPKTYPLPWCEQLDTPYWKANMLLIYLTEEWRLFQSKRSMEYLIPHIDEKIQELVKDGVIKIGEQEYTTTSGD